MAPAVAKPQQQETEFPKGTVVEKVVSRTDPTKTCALYLPTAYSPARKFPIIYCFDPAARGALPITHLRDAAEKYNYIVVGSNNSRNGVNLPTSEIRVSVPSVSPCLCVVVVSRKVYWEKIWIDLFLVQASSACAL